MNIIVNFLIVIVIGTLLLAIGLLFGIIPSNFIDPKNISTLPAIAISAGVLIASLAYLRDKKTQASENQRKSDEIILRLAKEGFDETFQLLSDLNNDRVTWIRAARTLCNSMALKQEIEHPPYLKAFNVAEERLRNQLYRLLQTPPKDPEQKNKVSLPPQFFYGIEDWKNPVISLDDAAITASAPIKVYSITIDEVTPIYGSGGLNEHSITAIYNFIETPNGYSEPLSKIKPWTDHYCDSYGIEQGAKRYIFHRREKHAVDGKIFDYNNNEQDE
ncbi:MAG: hypothetical protein L3J89_14645 [Gammaproteobacteria bacterium]|nr:hypothetical protein [Gammaproteobacteria bacterium]